MSRGRLGWRWALLVVPLVGLAGPGPLARPPAAAAEGVAMVVYMPCSMIDVQELASTFEDLAAFVAKRVPRLSLTMKLFRRPAHAYEFVRSGPDAVALVVSEAPFLLDLPAGVGVVPVYRLVREGKETYRRVAVVKAANEAIHSLVDLRGRSLSVSPLAELSGPRILHRLVFGGEIDPEKWFAKVETAVDDTSAVFSVILDSADAALVADSEPSVRDRVGKDLRQVYASSPLSLPIVAVREAALNPAQRVALDKALRDLATAAEGKAILGRLSFDGLRRIGEGDGPLDRAALQTLPVAKARRLEIAGATVEELGLPAAQRPDPAELELPLEMLLPEVPIPPGIAEDDPK